MSLLKKGLNKIKQWDRRTPLTDEQKETLTGIAGKLSDEDRKVIYEVFTIQMTNAIRSLEEEILRGTAHSMLMTKVECDHVTQSVLSFVLGVPPVETDTRIRLDVKGESGNPKP